MANPITDLLALRHAPVALANNLDVIAKGMSSVSAIEALVASAIERLDPLVSDVRRVRETVEPQQQRVAHMEEMMQTLERRTAAIERTVQALAAKADEATQLLPDPEDRGMLTKAKDAVTGG